MIDVAPALYEGINKSFTNNMVKDIRIKRISNRIRDGTATQIEGKQYAEISGENLAKALKSNLTPDNLPDGKLYYNIANRTIKPALKNNYDLINTTAADIQSANDLKAGIGLNSVKAPFPDERINGLIDKITMDDITPERILYWLGEPIINNSEAFFDDFIKENADFRQKAGLKSTISRILAPGCCEWCADVAGRGTYTYGDEPEDFYRRHEYCRCTVTFQSEKTSQNVWTKRTWQSTPQEIARRIATQNTARNGISEQEAERLEILINNSIRKRKVNTRGR